MVKGARMLRRVVPVGLLLTLAFGPAEAVDRSGTTELPTLEWWCALEGLHTNGRLIDSTARLVGTTDGTTARALPALSRLTSGDGPRSGGTERAVTSNASPGIPGVNR